MYVDIKCLKKRIGTLSPILFTWFQMYIGFLTYGFATCNLVKWIYLGKSSVSKGVSVTEVAWWIRRWLRSITWTDREGKDLFGVLSYHHPTAMHASMHVEGKTLKNVIIWKYSLSLDIFTIIESSWSDMAHHKITVQITHCNYILHGTFSYWTSNPTRHRK